MTTILWGVALGVTPFALWGFHWLRWSRRASREWLSRGLRARHLSVRHATKGSVHLEGRTARADRTLTGPLTGKTCFAFSLEVFGDGDRLIHQEREIVSFWIHDSTGWALVAPTFDSSLRLRADEPVIHDGATPPPAPLLDHLNARGVDLALDDDAELRVIERRLEPDEVCGVFGEVLGFDGDEPLIGDGHEPLMVADITTSTQIKAFARHRRMALIGLICGVLFWAMLLAITLIG